MPRLSGQMLAIQARAASGKSTTYRSNVKLHGWDCALISSRLAKVDPRRFLTYFV